MINKYTLILKHEAVIGGESIQIDPPLVLEQLFYNGGISPVVLNNMLEKFASEVMQRNSTWEKTNEID